MKPTRRHVTLAGVATAVTLIGGLIGAGVDWTIKTNERLARSAAADSALDARFRRIERKLGLRPGGPVEKPRRGIVRSVLSALW